jgi:peptidoglycan/LPS O-acetylase OafA/YrhL
MTSPHAQALEFNPVLHGLRGVAAIAVLLFHWGSSIGFFPELRSRMLVYFLGIQWDLGILLDFGWLGVPLFFILSGYLLTTQLLGRDLNLPTVSRFWLRRGLRIYPAFWLQFGVLIALGSAFNFMPQLASGVELVRHVFLWINLPPWMTAPLINVWWTLPIELSFYLMLPLLVLISRYTGWKALVVSALVISISWRYAIMYSYQGESLARHLAVLDSIPGTLFTFCVGFALANILVHRSPMAVRHRLYLLGAGVAGFYALTHWLWLSRDSYWTGHWMLGVWNPLMAFIIGTMLLALIEPLPGFKWLASKPMVWLGEISYGIYLWHYPVLMFLARGVLSEWRSPVLGLAALMLCLVATLTLASLSYYGLEKPIMQKHWKLRS